MFQICEGELQTYKGKYNFHYSLEGLRVVLEPEWNHSRRAMAIMGCKRSFVEVALVNLDLPVTKSNAQLRTHRCISFFCRFSSPCGEWSQAISCRGGQLTVVDDEAQ